jgi:hypothetical protein
MVLLNKINYFNFPTDNGVCAAIVMLVNCKIKDHICHFPKNRVSNQNYSKIIVAFFCLMFPFAINTFAQEKGVANTNASLAEKVYLQLDRKVYTNGDTVWFKCIITNDANHSPSNLSGVLYVELIGEDKTILQKKIVKVSQGIGQGNLDLDKNIPKGNYLIRAYTQWNLNFDDDFIYEQYIQVFTKKTQGTEPIQSITLIKDKAESDYIEVSFNPRSIDSLQNNKLTVFITVDDKKDSLLIKKDKDDKYRLLYSIKKESQFATVKIQTENDKTYTKTVVFDKDYVDLQFFPESGDLVHSLNSIVGFKAVDANGKGKLTEGDIIDEKGEAITAFKSNGLGMGSFYITNVDSAKKYLARVKTTPSNNKSTVYPLPKVAATGTILSLIQQADKVLLQVTSNYLKNDSIYVRISFRGKQLYEKKAILNQGEYQSIVSTANIPEGIIAFTLLDSAKKPMTSRLFFNSKPKGRMNLNLSTDKTTYSKRDLTNLTIQTTNNHNEPIQTNTSVLVINKDELGTMQELRQNILSYFLIESELKGSIENPGYYFQNDSIKNDDLDALILTQGWSKYNYAKLYKTPTVYPEKSLNISGTVQSVFSEKKGKKGVQLTMMTTGANKSFYNQETDNQGKFSFELNDAYGKDIDVLFSTTKKLNQSTSSTVVLDKKKSPQINFAQQKIVYQIDSIAQPFINKNLKQKEIDDKFEAQFGSTLLNEVKVIGKMSPKKQKVTEQYGKPTTVISGKDIAAKEKSWSFGLFSVLLTSFSDKVRIEKDTLGPLLINQMPTLVIIDGVPVRDYDYPLISSISPSEVTSFEIIENSGAFCDLYARAFPSHSCRDLPPLKAFGNVIAIYTKQGIGLAGTEQPKGLTETTIPVFSMQKEFYAPKYENTNPDDWKRADTRTLLHWQPIINTDNLGSASASFYNTDSKGKVMIVVEAISDQGEIGYKELEYQIKD